MIFKNGVSGRVSMQFGPEVSASVLCGWLSSPRNLPVLAECSFLPQAKFLDSCTILSPSLIAAV